MEENNIVKLHSNLTDEEIIFMININHTIGQMGLIRFQQVIDVITKSVRFLQSEHIPCNIVNITTMVNKLVEPMVITHAETICTLYYLQENVGNIIMTTDDQEIPSWIFQEIEISKTWTCR